MNEVRPPAVLATGKSFELTFGTQATEVLQSVSRAGADLVNGAPRLPIRLDRVGYRQSTVPIVIDDPLGRGRSTAMASVTIATEVPPDRRGIHMSRIGACVAESLSRPERDLQTYARRLAMAIAGCQYGGATDVKVRAVLPYLDEPDGADTKGRRSLEHLRLIARARCDGASREARLDAGLELTHLIACPCVQQTYRHARLARGLDVAAEPFLTHSQRCATRVIVCGLAGEFRPADAVSEIERVLVRTRNTLPRPAELLLVYQAHIAPQFIEDALREALWAVYRSLAGSGFDRLDGRSRSAESIHDFDLSARATISAGELRAMAARG